MNSSENSTRTRRSKQMQRRKKIKRRRRIAFFIMILCMILLGVLLGKNFVKVTRDVAVAADVGNKKLTNENNKNDKNNEVDIKEKVDNPANNVDKENVDKSEEDLVNNEKEDDKANVENNASANKNSEKEEKNTQKFAEDKICYLTFDDGPTSNITPQILDTLKEYNVKATFFVIGKQADKYPELIKREKAEGHYVANHSYSHNYDIIYANNDPKNLIRDVEKCNDTLNEIIGETSNIMRFPGGSFKKTNFQAAINEAGYHFVDWNCLNGDAEGLNIPPANLIERVKGTVNNQLHITVLMHDSATKQTTVTALPKIIEYIQSEGYEFKTLDEAFDD